MTKKKEEKQLRVSKTKIVRKRIFKKKRAEVKRNKWGNKLCEPHGNEARKCNTFPCHGSGICKHNIQKSQCRKCGGSEFCDCGVRRFRCVKCGGGSICEHGKLRRKCKKCMPNTHYANLATQCIRKALKADRKECLYDNDLGMSVGDYRTWIEARWTNKDWTWDNYGTDWVIDHIEPVSLKVDKDKKEPPMDDIVRRLRYSNTQPLGKAENLRKGSKFVVVKVV